MLRWLRRTGPVPTLGELVEVPILGQVSGLLQLPHPFESPLDVSLGPQNEILEQGEHVPEARQPFEQLRIERREAIAHR